MAVEISVRQMGLTRDTLPGGFMERVQVLLVKVAAQSILLEPETTAYHQGRAMYAQRVMANPQQCATLAGPGIVMGINVTSTTTYDEVTKTSVCTATDPQLESQIFTLWNALGGLDTPS